jgi:hypothetical protein
MFCLVTSNLAPMYTTLDLTVLEKNFAAKKYKYRITFKLFIMRFICGTLCENWCV